MPFPLYPLADSDIDPMTRGASLSLLRWRWPAARSGFWTVAAVAAVISSILFVHLPVLGHYFFADDFFPLADIASYSTWGFVRDLLLLRDG
ncbi:MAG: hypothetical protein V3S01_06625, partial [Dehalococcoidia bacterium]